MSCASVCLCVCFAVSEVKKKKKIIMGKTIPNLPNSDLHKHTSCTLGNYKDKRKRSWRTRGGLSVSSASGQVACLSHEQVEQPNRQKKKKKRGMHQKD